eukprot:1889632-Amphidinium_carterae.1
MTSLQGYTDTLTSSILPPTHVEHRNITLIVVNTSNTATSPSSCHGQHLRHPTTTSSTTSHSTARRCQIALSPTVP